MTCVCFCQLSSLCIPCCVGQQFTYQLCPFNSTYLKCELEIVASSALIILIYRNTCASTVAYRRGRPRSSHSPLDLGVLGVEGLSLTTTWNRSTKAGKMKILCIFICACVRTHPLSHTYPPTPPANKQVCGGQPEDTQPLFAHGQKLTFSVALKLCVCGGSMKFKMKYATFTVFRPPVS